MPETSTQKKLPCKLCSHGQGRGIFAVGFWVHIFICLLFWELLLFKYSLTKILTCKLIQEKTKVKKKKKESEVRNCSSCIWWKARFSLMWAENSEFSFFMQSFSSALSLGLFLTHWNTNKLTVELTSGRAVLINKNFWTLP